MAQQVKVLVLEVQCEDLGSNPQIHTKAGGARQVLVIRAPYRETGGDGRIPGMSVKVRRQCWMLPFTLFKTGSLFFCYILQAVTGVSVNVVC